MRRTLLTMMLIATLLMPLSAFTDSFASTAADPAYMALIDAVKDAEDEETVTALYDQYIASDITMTERSRIEYHMARYFKDMDNEDKARHHVELEQAYLAEIPEEEGELQRRVAEMEAVSADYYVNGGLGKGMESSSLTKELYKDYPDEYYVALQEAFRLVYTPPIAGGSPSKALRLFNAIEKEADGLSKLDRFSLLAGKGIALAERGEYDESEEYLDEAESIYHGDPAIEAARRDNARTRRNDRNR